MNTSLFSQNACFLVFGASLLFSAHKSEAAVQSYFPTTGNTWLFYAAYYGNPDPGTLDINFQIGSILSNHPAGAQVEFKAETVNLVGPFGEFLIYVSEIVGLGGSQVLLNVASGQVIGSSGNWQAGTGLGGAANLFFVGTRFTMADGLHYGWIEGSSRPNGNSGTIFTVVGFGWNDTPEAPIIAGQVASILPVQIFSPRLVSTNFVFEFQTVNNQSYTIQQNTNLATTNWGFYTNFVGDGLLFRFIRPIQGDSQRFFRVVQP